MYAEEIKNIFSSNRKNFNKIFIENFLIKGLLFNNSQHTVNDNYLIYNGTSTNFLDFLNNDFPYREPLLDLMNFYRVRNGKEKKNKIELSDLGSCTYLGKVQIYVIRLKEREEDRKLNNLSDACMFSKILNFMHDNTDYSRNIDIYTNKLGAFHFKTHNSQFIYFPNILDYNIPDSFKKSSILLDKRYGIDKSLTKRESYLNYDWAENKDMYTLLYLSSQEEINSNLNYTVRYLLRSQLVENIFKNLPEKYPNICNEDFIDSINRNLTGANASSELIFRQIRNILMTLLLGITVFHYGLTREELSQQYYLYSKSYDESVNRDIFLSNFPILDNNAYFLSDKELEMDNFNLVSTGKLSEFFANQLTIISENIFEALDMISENIQNLLEEEWD